MMKIIKKYFTLENIKKEKEMEKDVNVITKVIKFLKENI